MIKPKTRKEVFMDAIAKGKKPAIEPLTREEVLMAEHAEREASGGGGGGGITYLYAEGNRLYTDIDRTEEVEYVDDFWRDQLDLGRMVIIQDVEDDFSPNLLTSAGGRVAYCGNKVFYSQGYMGDPE